MDSSRTLVHYLVARQLRVGDASIHDAQRFDELGLDPLNLVLIVLQLEDRTDKVGEFPLGALDHTRTVGQLVALVDLWLSRYRLGKSLEGTRPNLLHSAPSGHQRRP